VLSGLIAIASSWGLLHKVWITVMMSIAIAAWWLLFLVLVPRAYQEGQP
jgi:Zn-dependent protease